MTSPRPWLEEGFIAAISANLSWSEAARALLCMLPMLVAVAWGEMTYVVALGQGGFFFSSLLLPVRIGGRLIMGSILIALGLGFYLMGGTVAPMPVVAVIFTFFAALNLSFLTSWRIGGPIALSIVMIYTAGLNTGSPEKAAANFLAFALVMAWATLISMLPILDADDAPEAGSRGHQRGACPAGIPHGHRYVPCAGASPTSSSSRRSAGR